MNIPMDVSSVKIATDKGVISISKIENGTAFDQDGKVIPTRYFKVFPHILSVAYNRDVTLV
jgi:hypothetical protein